MAILKAPPRQLKNATLQVRMEENLKLTLARYGEFIGSSTSYVVSEALKLLFKKDGEFKQWLAQYSEASTRQEAAEGL